MIREPSGKRKQADYLDARECPHASYLESNIPYPFWSPTCCDCGTRAERVIVKVSARKYAYRWVWPS